MLDVPAVVRNKATAFGAEGWLVGLPALVDELRADWSISVGDVFRTRPRRSSSPPRAPTVPPPS